MVVLFSASLAFFLLQQSLIMEARYKKPWEGVAIATLLALMATPKAKPKTNVDKPANEIGT